MTYAIVSILSAMFGAIIGFVVCSMLMVAKWTDEWKGMK